MLKTLKWMKLKWGGQREEGKKRGTREEGKEGGKGEARSPELVWTRSFQTPPWHDLSLLLGSILECHHRAWGLAKRSARTRASVSPCSHSLCLWHALHSSTCIFLLTNQGLCQATWRVIHLYSQSTACSAHREKKICKGLEVKNVGKIWWRQNDQSFFIKKR